MATGRGMLVAAATFIATVLCVGSPAGARDPGAYRDEDCVRCHADLVKAFAATGGLHRDVGCTSCHDGHPPAVAKPHPECGACHEPHSASPAVSDCALCHRAHSPREVTVAVTFPSAACGACHEQPLAELAATSTKHGTLACAICHRGSHGTTRSCGDCHGRLHPEPILARFPHCADCHHTAHDLNQWPAAQG